MRNRAFFGLQWVVILIVLQGCAAGQQAFIQGKTFFEKGEYAQAVPALEEAIAKEPTRHEYHLMLLKARTQLAIRHLKAGQEALDTKDYATSEREFTLALSLAPDIPAAQQGLDEVRSRRLLLQGLAEIDRYVEQGNHEEAFRALAPLLGRFPRNPDLLARRKVLEEERRERAEKEGQPMVDAQRITLEFKSTDIRDALKILTKLSGVNFIPDDDVEPSVVDLDLYDVTPSQAIEVLLKLKKLRSKELNEKTILVYPDNPKKDRYYSDQVVQTIYLSHINAKKALNLLKKTLKSKSVALHEERNAIVIRDKQEVILLAEKILLAADRSEAEVMFELEVIEVSHSNIKGLGLELSPYSLSGGIARDGNVVASALEAGGSAGKLLTGSLKDLKGVFTLPTATFDFQKTLTDTEILASPSVRVKNGGKAKVHIGTKEPVITVTTTADTVSENVQYVDVGVKLDIEPTVELDGSINTKLALEVSNVTDRTTTSNGTLVLSISTTNAESSLVLRDGERTIIGGLLRDDKSHTQKGVAGLSDIPLLGDLFSNRDTNNTKREILLSIRPRILRHPDLPEPSLQQLPSGSFDNPRLGLNFDSFDPAGGELSPSDESM